MRWEDREGSRSIEDRRGKKMRRVGGGIGIGTILLVIGAMIFGGNQSDILSGIQSKNVGALSEGQ